MKTVENIISALIAIAIFIALSNTTFGVDAIDTKLFYKVVACIGFLIASGVSFFVAKLFFILSVNILGKDNI